MARSKKGSPEYKGDVPSSLVGKIGAMRTRLMILRGKKVEAEENGETFDDNLIEEAEAELHDAEKAVENFKSGTNETEDAPRRRKVA